MGVSTDAILCFGVLVPEEFIERFEEGDSDDEQSAAEKANPLGYMVYAGNAVDGCRLETHQSDEYPEYIVIPESPTAKHWAWRGSPKEIDPSSLVVGATWEADLKAFCKKHGIKWSKPRWYLCSYWG